MADDTLSRAEAQLQAGHALDALQTLADALEGASDEALYRAASRALIKAAEDPAKLKAWDGFAPLARTLLHHTPCPAPMLTLAHEAASNMTSGNAQATKALTAALSDIVQAELDSDPAENPGFKNVLVFALTTRALAGDWLDQTRLSLRHLDWFDRFSTDDLALPYSVMFNPDLFGQSRDELLTAYWPEGDRSQLHGLPPDRVLFFSWLAGRDAFEGPADLRAYLDRHLPGSEEDRAAARTLMLRHWPGAPQADLDRWGLSDIAELAAETATRAAITTTPARRKGAALLQNRPYQTLNAAKHRYAPALAGRGKPRVAICLSGQLRGYEAALATWREAILPFIEPVFFIHSWEGIGRSDAQPFRYVLPFAGKAFPEAYRQIAVNAGYPAMRARYPALFAALAAGNTVTAEALKATYGTPHVILEDDSAARFGDFSNQQKMHYKIHAADQMAQDHGGFDLHMRLRPDLAMGLVGFDWRDLKEACAARPVLFAEKPYGLHYANLMIGDQCAVASPQVMALYAGTWDSFPDLAQAGLARCPEAFTGHVSLALTAWCHGIAVERLPIRFGTLQDASPLGTAQILAALEADSRGDAEDQQLLAAARADLGQG